MVEKPPLIPRSRTNPVGQTQRIKRSRKAINRRLKRVERMILKEWDRLPVVVQNGRLLMNQFYDYQITLDVLQSIVRRITQELNDVGQDEVAEQVRQAYREGTAKSVENLARISDDYTRSVTDALSSRPVTRRAALAAARSFEEMEGFGTDTASDLSRILFRAVEDGTNPVDVAREIRRQFGISRRRAERIARSELTTALRRGRWDEAADAEDRFGINVRLLHYSALIAGRTRRTHAQRHGRIVTVQEQREWYAKDGNGINCLCTATEITVDENGEPLTGAKLIGRLVEQREKFIKAGAGET